ncbi:DUF5134 domain-containing protein [Streptomyces fragilis]|uniref:DUF5134 domain-containing protein n=1 Tax=Streptomyces fragilis TaxID=67301 RepID=A0ABV2YLA8_9ACTN|nr:DUF5134 domain-containing protein [Streptomyces fragilis]
MHGPVTTGWLLVALCAAAGAYCVLRTASDVEEQRRTAAGEAVMGFGMAAMAVPAAALDPPRWVWPVYAAVFAGAALHALWAARRGAHHLHHAVGSLAMVYMALAMTAAPAGHAGHGVTGLPLLTGVLLVYFTGYVLLSGARLLPAGPPEPAVRPRTVVPSGALGPSGPARSSGPAGVPASSTPAPSSAPAVGAVRWGDRPELARACRLGMGIAMLAMLLTM